MRNPYSDLNHKYAQNVHIEIQKFPPIRYQLVNFKTFLISSLKRLSIGSLKINVKVFIMNNFWQKIICWLLKIKKKGFSYFSLSKTSLDQFISNVQSKANQSWFLSMMMEVNLFFTFHIMSFNQIEETLLWPKSSIDSRSYVISSSIISPNLGHYPFSKISYVLRPISPEYKGSHPSKNTGIWWIFFFSQTGWGGSTGIHISYSEIVILPKFVENLNKDFKKV